METKIELTDSLQSAVAKMSEGNPGAFGAMAAMCSATESVDPQSAFGKLAPVLRLDQEGIYGTDIYVLYSDICDRNPARALAVLRSVQLGFLSGSVLADACSRQDYSGQGLVDVKSLYFKVLKRLDNFDPGKEAGFED